LWGMVKTQKTISQALFVITHQKIAWRCNVLSLCFWGWDRNFLVIVLWARSAHNASLSVSENVGKKDQTFSVPRTCLLMPWLMSSNIIIFIVKNKLELD
jgi:hypothetical protein